MPILPDKLPKIGTTIFSTMSALATQHGAVNLGQGFPDFDMSHKLTELVNRAMNEGHNQYAPMPGWMPLREALAQKMELLYGANVNPDTEITITPGGTYAIYTALTSILLPGDEVIVLEPAYDSYVPNIEVNGGVPVLVPLNDDFSIPWAAVRAALSVRTKAIIINSPHNPTGAILHPEDIVELRDLVALSDIFIISDEVYEHLIFDGQQHLSLLRYPDLMERSFICFSFGKTYHCTGWKLGYAVAPAAMSKAFRKIHQFNCFSCHTPTQVALAKFLSETDEYLQLGKFIQEKRDHFTRLLNNSRFDLRPSSGSYFICASYEKISSLPDAEFARWLTVQHGVAVIPVSAFYQQTGPSNLIRFCFAKQSDTLELAAKRLEGL